MPKLEVLLKDIRQCDVCAGSLPLGPRPILQINPEAKILIIGQAPGIKVHESGIPWNDTSGDRLRLWLGVIREQFYNEKNFALVPLGFCYPGTGKSGDLPPREECAPLWHQKVLKQLSQIQLTLLLGRYAHQYYLESQRSISVAKIVKNWKGYIPDRLPLPHPSPRNNIWLKKNAWFEQELVPYIQRRIQKILKTVH